MTASPGPNDEYIDVWNSILVPKFRRFRDIFVKLGDAHSRGPIARLGLGDGNRVLDVGCGFGETTIQLARLVGPSGSALGIDCCEPFLETARGDAERLGVKNVRFELGDGQSHRFEPGFDACFSRFGVMFFQSPVSAFRNIRTALKPGGRVLALVWRTIDDNDWAAIPKRIARAHLPPPPDQAPTCGPGPFSMADPATAPDILAAAGFVDVKVERVDVSAIFGKTVDEAIEFQLQLGPAGEIVRDAGDEGQARLPAIKAELGQAIRDSLTSSGVVFRSSSWAVTARRPS